MKLKRFKIENFRGIESLVLELGNTTVLIGENNSGKSSILDALHICMNSGLGRRAAPFSEFDFHYCDSSMDRSTVPRLALTMTWEESADGEWSTEFDQVLSSALQVMDDGRKCIVLQVTAAYNPASDSFAADWNLLNVHGLPLVGAKSQQLIYDLQRFSPVFLLSAVRDAAQYFGARSSFWRSFTSNPQLSDEHRIEIEEQIEQINQLLLDDHKPFEIVRNHIAKTGKLLPMGTDEVVSLRPIPTRVSDMLANTQLKLASKSGARLPVQQHGAGTQSLSIIFLFEAFLQAQLSASYSVNSEPILALEEPEAHLHPSAIRSLWTTLDELPGQKIVATHSGDLLATAPLESIRRLIYKNGRTHVHRLGTTLSDRDLDKVSYHVRSTRGSLLFARCWMLVEGWTDYALMPEFARTLGLDFDLCGVACVEFAQCGLTTLISLANDLGIEWHVLVDGDTSGTRYVQEATRLLGQSPFAERVTQLSEKNIEHCLWLSGYDAIFEAEVTPNQRRGITATQGTPEYIEKIINAASKSTSKTHLAYNAAKEVAKPGSPGVPKTLEAAIDSAVLLATR